MRPERTWGDVTERLRVRQKTLSRRDLLPAEKRALAALILQCQRKGISYEEIAEALGCSVPNVDQFFTGQHGVSFKTLQQYSDVLGVTFDIVFKEQPA